MKNYFIALGFILSLYTTNAQTDTLKREIPEVHIKSLRGNKLAMTTSSYLTPIAISHTNLGQDAPTLLQQLPSINLSSDAGNGIGYSYLYVRGIDAQRIQVNINGIPYNDAESQEVYWVNIPDMFSSADNIQIQRGVGYSALGGSGIGGTISIKTTKKHYRPFVQLNSSFGSFNSLKSTINSSTGILENGWQITTRGSWIQSDGFIDRASSRLGSGYLDISKYNHKSSHHLIVSHGREKTYQSWYGLSQSDLESGNIKKNIAGTDYEYKSGDPYPNQVDNYNQSHMQFINNFKLNEENQSSITGYFTKGKGYYEEYKVGVDYSKYSDHLIGSGDLIRQLWLSNYLYGINASHIIEKKSWTNTSSISFSKYLGYHFGNINEILGSYLGQIPDNFYKNQSDKNEISIFNRTNFNCRKSNFIIDLQLRNIDYLANGKLISQSNFSFDKNFIFFNPKLGWNFKSDNYSLFSYLGMSHREPVRSDFLDEDKLHKPQPERVYDLELGLQKNTQKYDLKANLFAMYFVDQLIPTGNLNSVGASIRKNIAKSYRAGVEVEFSYHLNKKLLFYTNQYIAVNRIIDYNHFIPTYNPDFSINDSLSTSTYSESTDIAFSPSWISYLEIKYEIFKNTNLRLINKIVGSQYLDNTSTELKSIPMYTFTNISLSHKMRLKDQKELELNLLLNNIFDKNYITRGYTYNSGNVYDGTGSIIKGQDYNYFFPQAGFNFLAGFSLKI